MKFPVKKGVRVCPFRVKSVHPGEILCTEMLPVAARANLIQHILGFPGAASSEVSAV